MGEIHRGGRLDTGQGEQLIDQIVHTDGLLHHHPMRLGPHGGRWWLFGHLQIALEHGQRGAQLVGDVGDEVLAGLLETAQAGDIPHHQHRLIGGVGHDAKLEKFLLVDREFISSGSSYAPLPR